MQDLVQQFYAMRIKKKKKNWHKKWFQSHLGFQKETLLSDLMPQYTRAW